MFAKFYLDIKEIQKLISYSDSHSSYRIHSINIEEKIRKIKTNLKLLVEGNSFNKNVIDGDFLKNYIFPTGEEGNYDIFISYSHDDKDFAIFLASWLEQKCKLRVFLDYYVWGSADMLLKEIDDNYCKQKNGTYNYKRRNYSTSHVHAMLSMAIMDIINNTECCIFINSKHSIYLSRLENSTKAMTLSPWIYEENKMMKLLPSHTTRRESKYFSSSEKEKLYESLPDLKMTHGVDFSEFFNLTYENLINLRNKGQKGLDELYGLVAGI
ncbi:MAG: toll/interleukin-1 receptor domain-containing protein [Muribaculaceae bacterium]|nr:toll/interleukin-1 receptor domain-containing protein [Muribaculaceae bacterium]